MYDSQIFYISPIATAENRAELYTKEQETDHKICAAFRFMLRSLLWESAIVAATYIGFESNSFCYSPT